MVMNMFSKTNKSLAYLYIVLFSPLLSINFTSIMSRSIKWTDLIILFGYIIIVTMMFIIIIYRKCRTNEFPYYTMSAVWVLFVFLPIATMILRPSHGFMLHGGFFAYISIISFIKKLMTVLICFVVPFFVFYKNLGLKAKILCVLISIVYFIYHFYIGLGYRMYFGFMNYFPIKFFPIKLEVMFFILVCILNGFDKRYNIAVFYPVVLGLAITQYGFRHTVDANIGRVYGDITSSFESINTFKAEIYFDTNLLVAVGIGILVLAFIRYFALDGVEKKIE